MTAGAASRGTAQTQTVTGGARQIMALDFSTMPVGDFPKRNDLHTQSSLEIVDHNGVHLLKAGLASAFVIDLPENLPDQFTLEFDVVSQECCGSDDLAFETTRNDPNQNSAKVSWSPAVQRVSGGGGSPFTATTRLTGGQLDHVLASVEGTTIKLYTDNVRLYTVSGYRLVRGQVLRVSLNGTDEGKGAVYLARVRIAEGVATVTQIASAPVEGVVVASAPPTSATGMLVAPPPAPPPVAAPSGAWSGGVTRTGATTVLASPNRLHAEGTPAMATLTWLEPTGWTPTGYTVVRNTVGTSESFLLTSELLTTTRYEDHSGFTAGKTYEYVVTALSPDPKAFGSAQTSFTPPPPQNVSNVVATRSGDVVTLSWSGVAGADKYMIASSVEAMAREIPGTQTSTSYSGLAPGSYTWAVGARYEPGPIETPAATWPSVMMELLAPRSITQAALNAAGGYGVVGSRTVTLAALYAAGFSPSLSPRTVSLTSLIAVGASAVVAPPTITLSGLSATGGFVDLAPRIITLMGLTAASGAVALSARTVTLPGLSVAGITRNP